MSTETLEYWPQSELVSAEWVKKHLQDKDVKIVEVLHHLENKEPHNSIPGSTYLIWDKEIDLAGNYYQDNHAHEPRDHSYRELLDKIGVKNRRTTIVLYSDFNNWFAAIVFWMLKHFGHENVKLLDGGRQRWLEKKIDFDTKT